MLADKREPGPELNEELPDVGKKALLEGLLLGFLGERQELELVRVFQRLAGKIGLESREGPLEVRARFPLRS